MILDTGANLSVVSRSMARRLGLVLSEGTGPVDGFGGKSSHCHVAVIPLMRIGKAEIRNVAALIMEDNDLYIPQVSFQFGAILGYPVLSSLGRISFHADGQFGVSLKREGGHEEGARMFMEELTPLVAARIGNAARLVRFVTGASSSYLTARYWQEHQKEFAS